MTNYSLFKLWLESSASEDGEAIDSIDEDNDMSDIYREEYEKFNF